jgi:hypothetical protein
MERQCLSAIRSRQSAKERRTAVWLEAIDGAELVGAADLDALVLDKVVVAATDRRHLSATLQAMSRLSALGQQTAGQEGRGGGDGDDGPSRARRR